jgi:hypothetical protein
VSVDSLFDIDSDETVDRVLNVCKIWIDRYFEDFQQDRTLLTKLVEFVDKSMLPNEKMARAGENMKAQIANKLSTTSRHLFTPLYIHLPCHTFTALSVFITTSFNFET